MSRASHSEAAGRMGPASSREYSLRSSVVRPTPDGQERSYMFAVRFPPNRSVVVGSAHSSARRHSIIDTVIRAGQELPAIRLERRDDLSDSAHDLGPGIEKALRDGREKWAHIN
jgi:hypothetical protein